MLENLNAEKPLSRLLVLFIFATVKELDTVLQTTISSFWFKVNNTDTGKRCDNSFVRFFVIKFLL